ncbi:DUF2970 domain-containing protein [Gilvimarinus algae]|uniref:DUF2970 domain-containing protein n=1 Tax=Gilvimarinus algae TaxID=3058037 RepID=A0ABT8TEJ6_9GAMM|nr:DUF2970 domain-containing protein [Gilvimarinus sp. SDUM040014]MDO3382531.1 DUF2970 domain-containing protein [Gilvimarinus sp. SDUM040014]
MSQTEPKKPQKPGVFQIILSTLAAAFGVQSNKNRERDFSQGNLYIYIVAGISFTLIFVLSLVFLVRQLLQS